MVNAMGTAIEIRVLLPKIQSAMKFLLKCQPICIIRIAAILGKTLKKATLF